MHLSTAVFAFSVACLAALFLTPLVRRAAIHAGWRDRPNQEHKAHLAARPNVGGLALVFSLGIALWAVRAGFEGLAPRFDSILMVVVPGALLVAAMGLLDDLRGCRPAEKLLAQIVALVLLQTGADVFGVSTVSDWPLVLSLGAVAVLSLWMLALTNAMNLIDGIDGLATGVSAFSALGLVVLAVKFSDPATATLAAAVAGAALGFLRSNRAPARIYLGDSGSLLLGYLLAVVGAILLWKRPEPSTVLALGLLGWVPLLDTIFAVARRLRSGVSPFRADRDHLHHRLVRSGLSTRRAALVLWLLQGLAVLTALVVVGEPSRWIWTFGVVIATLPLARVLRPMRVTRPVIRPPQEVGRRPLASSSSPAGHRAA